MATKQDLNGSFGSLIDTLTSRFDPLQPEPVVSQWLGLMAQAASLARARSVWLTLDDENAKYRPVIAALDASTRKLVTADYDQSESVRAALATCSVAFDALANVLES